MSAMAREAAEAPEAVARFLQRNDGALKALGQRLRNHPPAVILTSARGSSDHAAGYLKYLVEILFGIPCCSMGASVVSIYGATLAVKDAVCITISQSGMSPDIVALQDAARAAGAYAVALVNAEDSLIAQGADLVLPLCAGPEKSVAATKSFIAACAASAAIAAHWQGGEFLAAVAALPAALDQAKAIDLPEAIALARESESLYVLGRGLSLPIAAETALKLKETCAIHAEAYSAAEVMHGPLELLGADFPVLVYAPADAARASTLEAIARLRRTGARVVVVEPATALHPFLAPIAMIQTAYRFIEATAQARGRDPDRPRHLKKITETV